MVDFEAIFHCIGLEITTLSYTRHFFHLRLSQKYQSSRIPALLLSKTRAKFDAGIEELIKDFQWNTQPVIENPLINVKNDELDLSDKQQQKSLGQQQPPHMTGTMKHFGCSQNIYQASNGNQIFSQNWGSIGSQVPGPKQMGSTQYLHTSKSSAYARNSSS